MNAYDILYKKREGGELTSEEIRFFIRGIADGSVPDYQISAWLMAVCWRDMSSREMRDLTLHIRDSGKVLDLAPLGKLTLDKHSTGGVGDKTSLVVVPMLAACGVPMLKISGRGLGHSGGTIDKLESIPGFRTELTAAQAMVQTQQIGAALIGQSADLAPADKYLYALRDVTATVESIPLIASSVMSKKLASGASRILLDVKVGSGAFMKTRAQAEELALALVSIGNSVGVPTRAVLTAMEEPLGYAVGNALEVEEVVRTLMGEAKQENHGEHGEHGGTRERENRNPPTSDAQRPTPFRILCVELAAHGLELVGIAPTLEAGRKRAEEILMSGEAAAKFAEVVAAQGGPSSCEAILASLPVAPIQHTLTTEQDGMVSRLNALDVGLLVRDMGGGRTVKTDVIDPAVGVVLQAKVGDSVHAGEPLATLHIREKDAGRAKEFAARLRAAYRIEVSAQISVTSSPILSVLS